MNPKTTDRIHTFQSGKAGLSVGISFGVHGNERPPIEAGERLLEELTGGALALSRGRLTLIHANPVASAEDRRWSDGGVDLNRCFHTEVLAREPALFEERRARAIVAALEAQQVEVLVDFHCTVEPGRRFLMHHPPVSEPGHRSTTRWLAADVLLADPTLQFGAVSLDEWMSTRGRVGVCYETGWIRDPANTAESVLAEMKNLLAGLTLIDANVIAYDDKTFLELDRVLRCEQAGFRWREGIGENLQELPAGTVLGAYHSGTEVTLEQDASLIFPKKKPELVEIGKPLVYLAARRA